MANRSLRAQAKSSNGDELTVHSQDTDALILPVAQLEAMHQFRPDLVDIVVAETRAEAQHRRSQENRINLFIFAERLVGQASAIVLSVVGVGGAVYAGINGAPAVGIAIVTVTIGTLAVTMVTRRQNSAQQRKPPAN